MLVGVAHRSRSCRRRPSCHVTVRLHDGPRWAIAASRAHIHPAGTINSGRRYECVLRQRVPGCGLRAPEPVDEPA